MFPLAIYIYFYWYIWIILLELFEKSQHVRKLFTIVDCELLFFYDCQMAVQKINGQYTIERTRLIAIENNDRQYTFFFWKQKKVGKGRMKIVVIFHRKGFAKRTCFAFKLRNIIFHIKSSSCKICTFLSKGNHRRRTFAFLNITLILDENKFDYFFIIREARQILQYKG